MNKRGESCGTALVIIFLGLLVIFALDMGMHDNRIHKTVTVESYAELPQGMKEIEDMKAEYEKLFDCTIHTSTSKYGGRIFLRLNCKEL